MLDHGERPRHRFLSAFAFFAAAVIAGSAQSQNSNNAKSPVTTLATQEVTWTRDPAVVPYAEAFKYFASFDDCPRMDPRFKIAKSDKFDIASLRINLVGETTDIEVPVNAEMRTITVPRDVAALKDKAEFMLNQKAGVVDVRVDAVVKPPTTLDLHYRELMDAVDQANRCEKKVVPFAIRVIRKDYTGLRLRFDGQAALLVKDGSEEVWKTNEKGVLAIPVDAELMRKNPEITLSRLPQVVEPAHVKPRKPTKVTNR